MKLIAALVCLLAIFPQGVAQRRKSNRPQVVAIETYCKDVDNFIKRNNTHPRIFANVASGVERVPVKWQEFNTESDRQTADTGENLNENAYVWIRNGKLVGANFTFQSPSRDWVKFVMYYFREDGTLAATKETFNTFNGNLSMERKKLFDAQGKLLRSSVKYSDLQTGWARRSRNNFTNEDVPIYRTIQSLPFYGLL